jgi:hypothetical protein
VRNPWGGCACAGFLHCVCLACAPLRPSHRPRTVYIYMYYISGCTPPPCRPPRTTLSRLASLSSLSSSSYWAFPPSSVTSIDTSSLLASASAVCVSPPRPLPRLRKCLREPLLGCLPEKIGFPRVHTRSMAQASTRAPSVLLDFESSSSRVCWTGGVSDSVAGSQRVMLCHSFILGAEPSVGISKRTACGRTSSTLYRIFQSSPWPCLRM